MDECRELFDPDRAPDIAVRVHGIDDDERFREGPRGRPLELEDRPGPPGEAGLEDAPERAVLQDEEFAEVSAESKDLRLGAVDADALRPGLQQTDLVRLSFLDVSQDVVDMEGRAIDCAHALARVRDPIARDNLDLEPTEPAARVRMLGIHAHGLLEDVPQ